jgi:hypothetical protein
MTGYAGWGRKAWGEGSWGDDPHLEVTIVSTNSPVEAGQQLEVDVKAENLGGAGEGDVELTVEEQ